MAVVIVHPEWGIYLGNCMGLGFWTKLDPIGQTSAVTFPTEQAAKEHIATWDTSDRQVAYSFVHVQPDDMTYASIAACELAGLDVTNWKFGL